MSDRKTVRDVELKTAVQTVTGTPTDLGIGAVPAGMRRWITFIKTSNLAASANALFLCSGTTATDASTANRVDKVVLGSQYDLVAYPDTPDVTKPLFSIGASRYLTVLASASSMETTIQYYDE
jgi:hypothetical protein